MIFMERKNAEAKIGKKQSGSIRPGVGMHAHDLWG